MYIHDGEIPTVKAKDPKTDRWFKFEGIDWPDGETITDYGFLINDQEVTAIDQSVDGLVYKGKHIFEDRLPQVRLTGGILEKTYRVTLWFSTASIPYMPVSFDLPIEDQ